MLKSAFFAYWRQFNREIGIESENNAHTSIQSIIWTTQTRPWTWKLAENCKKSKLLIPLSRAKISELENLCGNGLHLSKRVLEILHLNAETEPWMLADPKITQFENRIILLKIDPKWLINEWRRFLPTMVSIEKL